MTIKPQRSLSLIFKLAAGGLYPFPDSKCIFSLCFLCSALVDPALHVFSFVKIPVLAVLPEAGGDSQGSDGALAPVKPEVL